MKKILLAGVRFAVIAGAVFAAGYLLVLIHAEQLFEQDTAVSVAAAVHLQPHNADYLDRLASWQPEDRQNLLKRSVQEDPFNYDAWIRLGLLAEMQDGDSAAAERYYRKAAEVNHMFLPRWTLTNFYFRQQRPDDFFHWTRETLAVTPYASDPVFAQMWLMSQRDGTLNGVIPNHPRTLLQYAWYLANNRHFDSVPAVVERLVRAVGKDDPAKWGRNDLLAFSLDHMLAAGYLQPALQVWSILNKAGWLDEPAPNANHPLINGDFHHHLYRHGFDWVTVDNAGTRIAQYPEPAGLRISLYGDEAEHLTLLQQYVDVTPGNRYELKWHARGDDVAVPSGFNWHLHPIRRDGVNSSPEVVSGDLLADAGPWSFVAPEGSAFLLTLEYARQLGTTRAKGSVALKEVSMGLQ